MTPSAELHPKNRDRRRPYLPDMKELPERIVNTWIDSDGTLTYRVEFPHSRWACNPTSFCVGRASVTFTRNQREERQVPCTGCGEIIKVDVMALQIGLGIWDQSKGLPRRIIRDRNNPKE